MEISKKMKIMKNIIALSLPSRSSSLPINSIFKLLGVYHFLTIFEKPIISYKKSILETKYLFTVQATNTILLEDSI